MSKVLSCLFLFVFAVGCTKASIYDDISAQGDGVIDVSIPDESANLIDEPALQNKDILSETEQKLIDDLHDGKTDRVSFIIVDAENKKVMRSYKAGTPRRLASVSKISTALGALENVRNVEPLKVRSMLKSSNNGEASRYVRLAAKAINGTIAPGRAYTQKHSCPNAFLNEEEVSDVVLDWLTSEIENVDWAEASINDGAGCHYDNFLTSFQTSKILQFADSKGKAYAGMSFERLLSISGTDGTWKNRNKDHKGRILGKTGTLNPNSNIAGYFYAKRKKVLHKYYFAIYVEKEPGSQSTNRARKLKESLLRYWVNYYAKNTGEPISEF